MHSFNPQLNYYFPIYVINGETYFKGGGEPGEIVSLLNNLSSMNVNEFKKVMVLPPGSIPSYYADAMALQGGMHQSLVAIETYDKGYRGDSKEGGKKLILEGLDAPRTFYSPSFEGPLIESPIYDGRATLYWKASIKTDVDGQAKIDFFTSDRQTSWEIIVNGIETDFGHPGQGRFQINSTLTHPN